MPNRYLVTGGAGFIGSHLCDALSNAGHEVIALDDLRSGKRANLAASGVRLIKDNVGNIAEHRSEIGRVDAIIHLAALISGYDSLADPDAYFSANLNGLQRVIDFAIQSRTPRILFASSSTVYGNREGMLLTEDTPPEPLTVYALTKLAGEHLLRLYGTMHGFSHCSLRLFNVYGPRQAPDHPYANVTCKFSHAAARRLPVKRYGDGEQRRDFVYVGDVVNAFAAVLERSEQSIYNVGTGRTASINVLINELGKIGNTPLAFEQCDPWPNDIRSIQADTSRFEREFGFRPEMGLEEGLRRTVEYFSDLDEVEA